MRDFLWYVGLPIWLFVVAVTWIAMRVIWQADTPFETIYDFMKEVTYS
jgi:hypothetical protein